MMPRLALGLLIGLLGSVSLVHSQEAAERFIPIGQSPGLSGTHTMIGEIQAVEAQSRTLTVAAEGRTYSVGITERTRIWIDRSHLALPALTGDFADCRRGLKVEVKFEDEKEQAAADWIKIQQAAS
ncbi:MAG: hypothetical protein ACT4O5_16420 [Gammaproteobacteria bacterium]